MWEKQRGLGFILQNFQIGMKQIKFLTQQSSRDKNKDSHS